MRIARAGDSAIHGAGEGKRDGRDLQLHLRPGRRAATPPCHRPSRYPPRRFRPGTAPARARCRASARRAGLFRCGKESPRRCLPLFRVAGRASRCAAWDAASRRFGRRYTKTRSWYPASRSDEEVAQRLGRAGTVRLPEIQRLERERGGNRVHVRNAGTVQAAEGVSAVHARIAVEGLERRQPLGLPRRRRRHRAAARPHSRRTDGPAAIGHTRRSARTPVRAPQVSGGASVSRREERRHSGPRPSAAGVLPGNTGTRAACPPPSRDPDGPAGRSPRFARNLPERHRRARENARPR